MTPPETSTSTSTSSSSSAASKNSIAVRYVPFDLGKLLTDVSSSEFPVDFLRNLWFIYFQSLHRLASISWTL